MNSCLVLLVLVTLIALFYVVVCLMQGQQGGGYMSLVAQVAPSPASVQTPSAETQPPANNENTWFVPSNAGIRSNYHFGSERDTPIQLVPRTAIDSYLNASELAEPTGEILPMNQMVEDELVNAFDGAIEELVETVTDTVPNDWLNEQCAKIQKGSLLVPSYRYNQTESADTSSKWKARAKPAVISAAVANRLGQYHDKPNQDNFHRMEQLRLSLAKDLGMKMGPGLKKITPTGSS